MIDLDNNVGIVETKYYTIEEPIKFESGVEFSPITVAYETYGKLNENKDNAIFNKWMIQQSDVVVTYVTHNFGGAAQFKEMAEIRGKTVIEVAF